MTNHESYRPTRFFLAVLMTAALGLFSTTSPVRAQSGNNTPRTIEIEAQSGLKYSPMRFRVNPGQSVKLVLKNTDRLLHNLLITQPGKRLDVVNSAMDLGAKGKEKNYVPDSDHVLWNIRILGKGEQAEIRFQAPEKEDVYPYVCTLPGHGFTMYGAMYVRKKKNLPPVSKDPHLPKTSSDESNSTDLLAPLPDRARVYREFLPNASPAAIAVALPAGESDTPYSYCFDAARCRLRYAWSGGFIDVPYKRGDKAKIKGDVYYRNTAGFPIRFSSPENEPDERQFLGYERDSGLPSFRYRAEGHRIQQIVKLRPDGPGIVQQFTIPDNNQPVWFVTTSGKKARLTSSTGTWQDGTLKLTAEQAKNFSITILPSDADDTSSSDHNDQ